MFFVIGRLLQGTLSLIEIVEVVEELSRSSLAKETAKHRGESQVLFNVETTPEWTSCMKFL